MKYRKRFSAAAAQSQPFPEKHTADGRALLVMIALLAVGGLATASVYLLSQNATESGGLSTIASCHDYNGLPIASGDAPAGMVQIPAGEFVMGNNRGHRDLSSGRFQPYPEERKPTFSRSLRFGWTNMKSPTPSSRPSLEPRAIKHWPSKHQIHRGFLLAPQPPSNNPAPLYLRCRTAV